MYRLHRLEEHIEAAVNRKCKKFDIRHRKMNGMGFRGWPDRLYLIPGGKPFFIEYKRPREDLTPLQRKIYTTLREAGYDVEVHTSAETAWQAIWERLGS